MDAAKLPQMQRLLEGLLTRDEFRAQLPGNPSERTIQRWEKMGLPVIRRGNLRLYDIVKGRAWLRGEEPARRRGRPRKNAQPETACGGS